MDRTQDTPVEYGGYYIVRDMIQPGAHERGEPNSAEYTRFAIMKAADDTMNTVNWALSEDAARAKIDHLNRRRSEETRRPPAESRVWEPSPIRHVLRF